MTLKRYLIMMAVTTLICWLAFMVVLFRIDPDTGGTIALLLFFISLFFSLWGTLSMLGFGVRFLLQRGIVPFKFIGVSLRQALWFAILVCLSLFLVSQELFMWWMALLLIGAFTVIEGFFMAHTLEARVHKRDTREQRSA